MAVLATFYDHIKEIAKQENIPVVEAMKEAKALGIEKLEISGNNILGREDELGQELAYTELGISGIPAYFDFGRDLDVKKQSEPILEAARYLGADKLLVIPGLLQEQDSREVQEKQIQNMVDSVNALAELAAGYGVALVMEEYDSFDSPFSTIAGERRFLDGCPRLSCAFDTGNFRFMAEDELEAYEGLRDRITHVHLKDRAYTQANGENGKTARDGVVIYPAPVGFGDLKIEELISRLKRDGYDGVYTIEHYDTNRMLDYLRQSAAWVNARI